MSGVVIRCQNCGTTQAALGECEACHEGEVRYFCPNHSPGRWLDEPECLACGARVGVPGRVERVAPPPEPPRPPASPRRGVPTRTSARRPPPPEEDDPEADVWSGPVRGPGAEPTTLLEELLRMGAVRRPTRIEPPMPDIGFAVASGFGCLRRVAIIAFFLMMLAAMFIMGLFGFALPTNLP